MAYNNVFPVTYPQYYPQQYGQNQMQQQVGTQMPSPQMSPASMPGTSQTNNLIWVQGEAGAKSYLVAPNTTVQLWDSEEQVIYLKSADASGMPSMKVLDYTIRDATPSANTHLTSSEPQIGDFVTKEEFYAFEDKIQKQMDRLSLNGNSRKKKEVSEDE